jgi:hypothetical protein
MECHLDNGLDPEMCVSSKSSEQDRLSDDRSNANASGIDAE